MQRKLRVTMELTLGDVETGAVAETEARDVGRVLEGIATDVMNEELFAGTGLFVRIERAHTLSAEWVDGA